MADASGMIRKDSIVRPQRVSNKIKTYIDLQNRLDLLEKEIEELRSHQGAIREEVSAHVNPGFYRISVGNKLAIIHATTNYGGPRVEISIVDIDFIHPEDKCDDHV